MNALAQSGLRDVEYLGGLSEAPAFNRGDEAF
jgi:hypothetical protein